MGPYVHHMTTQGRSSFHSAASIYWRAAHQAGTRG